MEPLILDASVLIGLLDTEDEHHARSVDDVEQADLAGRQLLAPASAYSESLVAFARINRLTDAREAIAGMGIAIVPLTAAELRARHNALHLPHALALATAEEHPACC